MTVLIRTIGDALPIVQVMVLRQGLAVLLMTPFLWRARHDVLRARGVHLHAARGFLTIGNMSCGFIAVLHIPLADAQAIQLSEAVFLTVLAAWILREKLDWRRWAATGLGLLGVIVMLRPFSDGFGVYGLIAVFGSLCAAGGSVAVRLGAGQDRLESVIFWQSVVFLGVLVPILPFIWVAPSDAQWLAIAAMGAVQIIGQCLFTFAIRLGSAAAIAPLRYVRLILIAVIGYLLYDEVPSLVTYIGAIAGSSPRRRSPSRRTPAASQPRPCRYPTFELRRTCAAGCRSGRPAVRA